MHAAETLECLGGNGYVEESGMPLLYREAPLLTIWEGSGNVAALDVVRAMVREPATVEVLVEELDEATGTDPRYDAALLRLRRDLVSRPADAPDGSGAAATDLPQAGARRLAESMALLLQGSLLIRHGDPAAADAFCASRLDGDWGHAFGTLPSGLDLTAILDRSLTI
jgi:putative acyl-CoA dehydrogenase